jgi:penicillin-binding protein 2
MSQAANPRQLVIRLIFIGVSLIILVRLLFLQLFEEKYKVMASDIAVYRKVVYPPRGIIYDRNDSVMCFNQGIYDLMVTPSEVSRDIDTVGLCAALGIDTATYGRLIERAVKFQNGPKRQSVFIAQLNERQTARFLENQYAYPGFQLVERSIRSYPRPSGGVILGYIGEVSAGMLKKERFASYRQGDYVGIDGLELTYEEVLRGQRGVHYFERDNFNRPRDPYMKGKLDTPAVSGKSLRLHVDAALQEYGEKLMANKLGSIVAIEPSTGGILAMVSSPGYDPNLLRGSERSRNFSRLYKEPSKPLFNRAMKAFYNPGSTQKPLTALIALDMGAITPSFGYPCAGGYNACSRRIACTHTNAGHAANLRLALANSCNAYFCHIYRLSVDSRKFGGVKNGLHKWYEYMYAFGFGHPTGVDLPYEIGGTLYDSSDYNRLYNGVWNSCTNVFIGMGQGEIAQTPLQMANAMCIIANRGFYYTPHFVQAIGGNPDDPLLQPFKEKHVVTNIPDTAYAIVALGMQDVVERGTARVAKLDGINVCAKTGTVENKAAIRGQVVKMKDHSAFVAFAPRENPKIAIAVVVENAGFGSTWAGPIASLMIEKYLNDTIADSRKPLEERMMKGSVVNPYLAILDSQQRVKDQERYLRRLRLKEVQDSIERAEDSLAARRLIENIYFKRRYRP